LLEWRVLNNKNALVGSTDVIGTVSVPFALLVAVPRWTPLNSARKHAAVVNALFVAVALSVNIADVETSGIVIAARTARVPRRTDLDRRNVDIAKGG
jgi:hypothetical protein